MGERLQKLCKVLSTVSVENHKFSAKVVTEGRAKLHHSAATQGKNQPGPEVFFYSCNDGRLYAGDQELFMHTMVGDTILALDVPFKLTFSEANEGTMLDADGGIWAVYGLKYEIDGDKGIVFKHAGITFVQHLTSKTHQNQLHIFSAQMTPHIAQFSAKIAVKQSVRFGEPAGSSNSSSAVNFCALSGGTP